NGSVCQGRNLESQTIRNGMDCRSVQVAIQKRPDKKNCFHVPQRICLDLELCLSVRPSSEPESRRYRFPPAPAPEIAEKRTGVVKTTDLKSLPSHSSVLLPGSRLTMPLISISLSFIESVHQGILSLLFDELGRLP